MSNDTKTYIEELHRRAMELRENGFDLLHSLNIADLEEKIVNWPKAWGTNFKILVYGDFTPLTEPLLIESLGISISPEIQKNTVIKNALTVHEATLKLNNVSIESIVDAIRRINILLGAHTLLTWGNGFCNWWSHITHGNTYGGMLTKLPHEDLDTIITYLNLMKPQLRKKIDSALYWLRNANDSIFSSYRLDILRAYVSYWNAFECLVDAINIVKPTKKMPKDKKQNVLEELFNQYNKSISVEFIQDAYSTIVNPGLKKKSENALNVCFGDSAKDYMNECFNLENPDNRLYNIRNAINHGEIDAENPTELARIHSRLAKLKILVLGMFGSIIPYRYPVEQTEVNK